MSEHSIAMASYSRVPKPTPLLEQPQHHHYVLNYKELSPPPDISLEQSSSSLSATPLPPPLEEQVTMQHNNLMLSHGMASDDSYDNNNNQMLYPCTDDLSSRASLAGDFSLSQFNQQQHNSNSIRSSRSALTASYHDYSITSGDDNDTLYTSDTYHTMSTVDLVLAKRYAANGGGTSGGTSSNNTMVGMRLAPPKLATIQSQGLPEGGEIATTNRREEVATGVLIDDDEEDTDDDEDIYEMKRRQQHQHPSSGNGTQPPPLRVARSAPIGSGDRGLDKTRTTVTRQHSANDHPTANRVRSDSLSTMSTMPDPPSLRQGGHYTEPGAYRMRSGGEFRMTSSDVDSLAGSSLRTQTTTVTRPPVLEASLVRDDYYGYDTSSLHSSARQPDVDHDTGSGAAIPTSTRSRPSSTAAATRTTTTTTATAIVTAAPTAICRNHSTDNESSSSSSTDDEECPSPPPPANYAVSQGELTLMTTATTASPIIEAQPLDDAHTFREFFANRKVRVTICCLSFLFIILALGTIYAVTGFVFDKNQAPTSAPTVVPSIPCDPGDPNLYCFVTTLPDYTKQALQKQNSPQSKALEWLRNNTYLHEYKSSQRTQRFALATFYYATGGDRRWEDSTGWLSDDDECTWYSRTNPNSTDVCKKGEYFYLDLNQNELRGTIPKEIALLSTLKVLDLDVNKITGFIPTTLSEMSLLREIHLCR